MTDLAEVLRPQPEQRGAVELGVAADVVVDLGRELVAVLVVPELRRAVLPANENLGGAPVVALSRQVVASLEEEDPLSCRREPVGEGATPRSGPDDDDVEVLTGGHSGLSGRVLGVGAGAESPTSVRPAAPAITRTGWKAPVTLTCTQSFTWQQPVV